MRITFVNRLAGIQWGGGESFDLEAARALRSLGHEVRFVIGRRWSRVDLPMTEFPALEVRTPYLRGIMYRMESRGPGVLRGLGHRAMQADLQLFERAAHRAIVRGGLDRWTEVYQINGLPRLGAWLRMLHGAVTTIVWHGPPDASSRYWNERCSATFAFGDALEVVRRLADPRAVEILPGVDTDRFRPLDRKELRVRYGIDPGAVVCLFVGRMIPVKQLPALLRAFAAARAEDERLLLLLVGDGPDTAELQGSVRSLGLTGAVRFAGRQEGTALVEQYNLADMLVLASQYESFGFVALEAMACGLPVIASRVGGLLRVIEEEVDGILVPPDSESELSAAIRRLAADEPLRRCLGEAGRRKVEGGYRWIDTATRMVELYKICREPGR